MQVRFKNILIILVSLTACIGSYSQAPSIILEGKTLYQLGRNSGGINNQEDIDSVTVTGTTKYYLLPDANVNPGFNPALNLFSNVISTFNWTVPAGRAAGVTDIVGYVAAPHYKQITWTSVGLGNLSIVETSASTCVGSAVTAPIEVISMPDVTGVTIANVSCAVTPVSVACPNATLAVSCVVKGNKGIKVSYKITDPANNEIVNVSDKPVTNAGLLDLSGTTLTMAGKYTLDITTITDRIASKCFPTAITETANAVFYVTITPKTGKTKHLPNDAAW